MDDPERTGRLGTSRRSRGIVGGGAVRRRHGGDPSIGLSRPTVLSPRNRQAPRIPPPIFDLERGAWNELQKIYGSGTALADTFGYAVCLDASELLVGAPHVISGPGSPRYAFLFRDGAGSNLIADADEVPLSQGGAQTLQLGTGTAHAGDLHVLAGSASGTTPGFVFAGQDVPLNPDVYFLHTVQHLTGPPLVNGLGLLDFNGFGEASFALPPGLSPSLAGLVLHHAYCVIDGATLQVEAVSSAAPVTLVP